MKYKDTVHSLQIGLKTIDSESWQSINTDKLAQLQGLEIFDSSPPQTGTIEIPVDFKITNSNHSLKSLELLSIKN